MVTMSTHCGGFIPRMEQGFDFSATAEGSSSTSEACSSALRSAQTSCDVDSSGYASNAACERLLEATPEALDAEVVAAHAANKH